ncbi:hypothetical protein BJX63DRAFT_123497 [Aspergillus granulosus]|uniref:Uncharacterized protein n=1 Tax=Aspergillus granulosus TaxID=176169 RepID=A0ABR4I5G5_9EURO
MAFFFFGFLVMTWDPIFSFVTNAGLERGKARPAPFLPYTTGLAVALASIYKYTAPRHSVFPFFCVRGWVEYLPTLTINVTISHRVMFVT